MSRCFPFPPPGYEHTARTENFELQLKENHKPKKDKKEKREKEKKEGKEKRHKDKSRDKHGEKKDRKEKHKDKDRKKDRDKKKDKENKTKEPGRISDEKAANLQIGNRHEEEGAANIKSREPIKDFKSNEGLYRTKEETTRTGSKVTDELRTRCIATVGTPDIRKVRDTAVNRSLTGNEQLGELGNMAREQVIGNNMAGNYVSAEQRNNGRNIHENGGLLGKYGSEKTHRMEKTKDSEADVRNRERHKDKIKKVKGEKIKLKNPTKDTKRTRDVSEHKAVEKRNKGEDVKNGHDREGIQPIVLPKNIEKIEKNSGFDGNLKKQLNGFSHEYATQPIKLAPLIQPPVDNGLCRVSTSNHPREGKQVETITDNRGHKANGFVNPQPSQVTSSKSTSGINGVPTKPPHPDTKYLDKVLSVPSMEELLETDLQEWLFSGGDGMERREAKRVKTDETVHVWAKAQRIEEADILAMPYVIPY